MTATWAIVHGNGGGGAQFRGAIEPHVEYEKAALWLRDIRDDANPDPRPQSGSLAFREEGRANAPPSGGVPGSPGHIGAFGEAHWLEEWTSFGSESDYGPGAAHGAEPQR